MSLSGRVLITGGTGFLGRGIMRKAKREGWPCEFVVLSRDEYKQDLCRQKYPDAKYILGDVKDQERLETNFTDVDTIIHTAAMKYIPEAEYNVDECVEVNVWGSAKVFYAARFCGVKNVVAISTDKAPKPINVYGMSKAIMERMVGEQARLNGPKYTAVRYGNVIGSTGSVIPLFQRQLLDQGYITVTNPLMTRFWISIDEAVQLVEDAVDCQINGSVVIPTPKAMSIGTLAATIADTWDMGKVKVIGLRPGERMHETLLTNEEGHRTSIVNGRFILHPVHAKFANAVSVGEVNSETAAFINPGDMLDCIHDAADV